MPLPEPVSAGLSAGAQTIGSIAGAVASRKNVKDTIRAQKEQAEYAYSKDLEQWQRANEYNLPSAQMQRLKDAGMNPAMMYGKGSAANVASPNLPKYSAVRPDYTARQSTAQAGVQGALDGMLKMAQIDNVRSQTKLTDEKKETETFNALLKNAMIGSAQGDSSMKQALAHYSQQFAKLALDDQKQTITNKIFQEGLMNQLGEKRTKEMRYQSIMNEIKQTDLDWLNTMKGSELGKNAMPIIKMLMAIFGK